MLVVLICWNTVFKNFKMISGLSILKTCENAFEAVALTASSVQVATGLDNVDKDAPIVVCYAESSFEDFPNSGIHHVKMNVVVKEMAADTSTSSSLANTIFQTFCNPNTKAALNSYPGFFVYEYFTAEPSQGWGGDAWHQTYSFDVISALTN